MKRKILAQFLAFGLALTSFPISAYAAEIQENVETKAESRIRKHLACNN